MPSQQSKTRSAKKVIKTNGTEHETLADSSSKTDWRDRLEYLRNEFRLGRIPMEHSDRATVEPELQDGLDEVLDLLDPEEDISELPRLQIDRADLIQILKADVSHSTAALLLDSERQSKMDKLVSEETHLSLFDRPQKVTLLTPAEKRALKESTAGRDWFDLPLGREEWKKEADLLALQASLDPKRFFKGGGARKVQSKYFALGKIIDGEELVSAKRNKHAGSITEELMRDAEAQAYAKRKFTDLIKTKGQAYGKKAAARRRR